ncbi:hypothetical protein L1277_000888 [Okibacterium sp. HSC-33S16]|uniref:hypothetical protein n=1 Tax=Okibacterium sp. HSC-33S16 TaxID=2910965 RepID=UPI0020A02141|nr:hypothetical protein [Okibacterium sp. HSC-33S16]MCP2030824.1 hypothetical protein [Okibacterium sp. HSC-33S16]
MPRLLPPILDSMFLPLAELCAACQDGDVVRLDEAFICVDEPDGRDIRARALRSSLPRVPAVRHLIATGPSAAWIHGAIDQAPWQHELSVRADERATVRLPPRFRQRELLLRDEDEMLIAGMRVTTVDRTLRDLSRQGSRSPTFTHMAQLRERLIEEGVTRR